jgi:hypothetical protein
VPISRLPPPSPPVENNGSSCLSSPHAPVAPATITASATLIVRCLELIASEFTTKRRAIRAAETNYTDLDPSIPRGLTAATDISAIGAAIRADLAGPSNGRLTRGQPRRTATPANSVARFRHSDGFRTIPLRSTLRGIVLADSMRY